MRELLQYRAVHHSQKECIMVQQDLFDSRYDVDLLEKRKYLAHLADPLLEVYGYGCYLCEEKIDRADCEVDHVLPRAHGGKDDWHNLRPTHWYCNQAKRDMMPDNPNLKAVIAAIPDKIKNAIRQKECLDCGTKITDRHWRSIYCKPCATERQRRKTREWHRENRDEFYEYRQGWREENRERERGQNNDRYANNPAYRKKAIERSNAFHEANPEYQKEYREKNRERINEKARVNYALSKGGIVRPYRRKK